MIRYLLGLLFVLVATASLAQSASEAELIAFGKELREVIMREDSAELKRYMKYGVATANDFYNASEVYKMLGDKTSWLYKRFFIGIGSAKAFLQRHSAFTVDISGSCEYYVITYLSSDGREMHDCPILVYKKNKKIYIGELPPCPVP